MTLYLRLIHKMHYYWAVPFRARAVIYLGFGCLCRKTVSRGEGRHEGLVPRNDVLTSGFILYKLFPCSDPFMNIFWYNVPTPRPLQKPRRRCESIRLFALFKAIHAHVIRSKQGHIVHHSVFLLSKDCE